MGFFIKLLLFLGVIAGIYSFFGGNTFSNLKGKIIEVVSPPSPREKLVSNLSNNFNNLEALINKLGSDSISVQEKFSLSGEAQKLVHQTEDLVSDLNNLAKSSDNGIFKTVLNKVLPQTQSPTPTSGLQVQCIEPGE
ncbi:MAG: hypothetical protein HYW77_01865 [Parcubacteria group bacterium]|nr:hypothetical protein [Parcubacteria group bacterium]